MASTESLLGNAARFSCLVVCRRARRSAGLGRAKTQDASQPTAEQIDRATHTPENPRPTKKSPPSPRASALPWPGMGRLAFCPSKCTKTTLSIRQTDLAERGVVDMLDACRIAEWRERVNQTGPASALPAFKTGRQRTRPFKLCINRPRQRLASDPGK